MKKKLHDIMYRCYEMGMAFLFIVFRIFPIKKNKVFVNCFGGKKYGDNCQFIAEELHRLDPEIKIIWVREKGYDFVVPPYIQCVKRLSVRRIYEYVTSKVWIATHYLENYVKKRKGQYFIQVWHAGLGMKKIGYDAVAETNVSRRGRIALSSELADLMISNSDYRSEIYRNAFGYQGEILKCGMPKSDVFFADKNGFRKEVREHYGLDKDAKILLYAPTYRSGRESMTLDEIFDLDYSRAAETLKKKFGGNWVVFVRWHPKTIGTAFASKEIKGGLNVTEYPDMQTLLLACDAFISDYSSGIFEARFSGLPCFLYARDRKEYEDKWGLNYRLEELPFPLAETNDELEQKILSFDKAPDDRVWEEFREQAGLVETGHASRDVAELILIYCK